MEFSLHKWSHYLDVLKTISFNAINNIASPGVMVLIYHRVKKLDSDPQLLSVSPEHFEAQLAWLKANYEVVPLQSISNQTYYTPNRPKVVITFDDGYEDNFSIAYPLLKKYELPATFFITTGFVEQIYAPYWDLLKPLKVLRGEDFYHQACLELRRLPTEQRWKLLTQKFAPLIGPNALELIPADFFMGIDEVIQMAKDPLVEIGAHTIGHPSLAALTPQQQFDEISLSKQQLEVWTNQKIVSFAHPYGTPADFNDETRKICQDLGFKFVAANYRGIYRKGMSAHEIPRCLVRDWPLAKFKQMLNYYKYF